jgi:hypothetical protein
MPRGLAIFVHDVPPSGKFPFWSRLRFALALPILPQAGMARKTILVVLFLLLFSLAVEGRYAANNFKTS